MTAMTAGGCTCGFMPDETHELVDHFNEVFMAADDMDADGKVHLEQVGALTCCCGFAADVREEIDAHFADVFPPPADRIGWDGERHEEAGAVTAAPAPASPEAEEGRVPG